MINPSGPGNPRNGEGAIVALCDGRLLMAWTHFTGPEDHAQGEIWACYSQGDGYTWGEPFLFQENIGQRNVMSASFLRLHCGDLLFGFHIKNHESEDCRLYVRRSSDDGKTWSEPILASPEAGYMGSNNDRMMQTRSGRILVPMFKFFGPAPDFHSMDSVFGSDDNGRTWRRLTGWLDIPGHCGASEPGIVECADGSLFMWIRTDKRRIYASRSTDNGDTWTDPQATELVAPIAPASAKRLPNSDDILMIYNDRRTSPPDAGGDVAWTDEFNWRTPLVSAISSDNGQTWRNFKLVEADESKSYCYTSITFHKDTTILTYYVGVPGGANLVDMKLKIVPTAAWTT
jgi:hypothetical protein